MWVEYRSALNLRTARMWKDLLDGEGLPAAIFPKGEELLDWSEFCEFRIMVPKGREHVADEILRKL